MTQTSITQDFIPSIIGLDQISFLAAEILGYIGVSIIVYGALKSVYHFLEHNFKFRNGDIPIIRIELGKHLALGLEFLVGKDIIESIVRPSWDDLGKLAAIILLRTAVTVMLGWELKQIKQELKSDKPKGSRKR